MASRALRTESDAANFDRVVSPAVRPLILTTSHPASEQLLAACPKQVAGSDADLLPALLPVPETGADYYSSEVRNGCRVMDVF